MVKEGAAGPVSIVLAIKPAHENSRAMKEKFTQAERPDSKVLTLFPFYLTSDVYIAVR